MNLTNNIILFFPDTLKIVQFKTEIKKIRFHIFPKVWQFLLPIPSKIELLCKTFIMYILHFYPRKCNFTERA